VTPLSNKIEIPLAERNPVVCRDDRIRSLAPQKLLNIREAICAALSQVTARQVETKLVDGGRDAGRSGLMRGWLAGGPGLRRGRRDPETLRYGDALDFWRVVGFELDRRLSLRAEIRLPGEGMLEFRIEPGNNGPCIVRQTALFQPHGLFGLLYWYAMLPLHQLVFHGMLAGVRRDALRIATQPAPRGNARQRLAACECVSLRCIVSALLERFGRLNTLPIIRINALCMRRYSHFSHITDNPSSEPSAGDRKQTALRLPKPSPWLRSARWLSPSSLHGPP
jgi:Protein of unknown function (DUF2867)